MNPLDQRGLGSEGPQLATLWLSSLRLAYRLVREFLKTVGKRKNLVQWCMFHSIPEIDDHLCDPGLDNGGGPNLACQFQSCQVHGFQNNIISEGDRSRASI